MSCKKYTNKAPIGVDNLYRFPARENEIRVQYLYLLEPFLSLITEQLLKTKKQESLSEGDII
jgi:hypothetical protein